MAKYYTPLDCFADVEKLYDDITPVRKREPEHRKYAIYQDVRPTNCRNRQYERIIKVNDNKYLLHDGEGLYTISSLVKHDYKTKGKVGSKEYDFYLEMCEATAAIIWERKRGKEVMTVRHTLKYSIYSPNPISRMDFLDRTLPIGWRTPSYNANQYVNTPHGNFVLPRNTFLPRKLVGLIDLNNPNRDISALQSKENQQLVFTRINGKWSNPAKEYGQMLWRVDTKKKKELKRIYEPFLEQALPLASMLDITGVTPYDEDVKIVFDLITPSEPINSWQVRYMIEGDTRPNDALREVYKQVMVDPEHPAFMAVVKSLAVHINSHSNSKSISAKTNDWVNWVFELKRKMEVK